MNINIQIYIFLFQVGPSFCLLHSTYCNYWASLHVVAAGGGQSPKTSSTSSLGCGTPTSSFDRQQLPNAVSSLGNGDELVPGEDLSTAPSIDNLATMTEKQIARRKRIVSWHTCIGVWLRKLGNSPLQGFALEFDSSGLIGLGNFLVCATHLEISVLYWCQCLIFRQ